MTKMSQDTFMVGKSKFLQCSEPACFYAAVKEIINDTFPLEKIEILMPYIWYYRDLCLKHAEAQIMLFSENAVYPARTSTETP